VSRYTCKHLEADLARLRESVPGWTGEDADGTFRVAVHDRGGDYPYRYTLVMEWSEGRGQVNNNVPGWPFGWPGRYFRTAREVWGEMYAAAHQARQAVAS
jgi:hypothetical protein